jgi:uridylate kinase
MVRTAGGISMAKATARETVVLSVGGSILVKDMNIDNRYLQSLSALLRELSTEYKIYIVVGGGSIAREYIAAARSLGGASEVVLDDIGIDVTRLNAKLLIAALRGTEHGEDIYPLPAKTTDEAFIAGKTYSIVVSGGISPGYSTDAVSAMLAERVGADRLIIATSVDGVYTSDPRKSASAKKLDRLTHAQLIDITLKSEMTAGAACVIDPLASKLLARSNITTLVLHGRDLDALRNAVCGERFKGTVIKD